MEIKDVQLCCRHAHMLVSTDEQCSKSLQLQRQRIENGSRWTSPAKLEDCYFLSKAFPNTANLTKEGRARLWPGDNFFLLHLTISNEGERGKRDGHPLPSTRTNHILFETSTVPNIIFTNYYSAALLACSGLDVHEGSYGRPSSILNTRAAFLITDHGWWEFSQGGEAAAAAQLNRIAVPVPRFTSFCRCWYSPAHTCKSRYNRRTSKAYSACDAVVCRPAIRGKKLVLPVI